MIVSVDEYNELKKSGKAVYDIGKNRADGKIEVWKKAFQRMPDNKKFLYASWQIEAVTNNFEEAKAYVKANQDRFTEVSEAN